MSDLEKILCILFIIAFGAYINARIEALKLKHERKKLTSDQTIDLVLEQKQGDL